MMLDVSCPKAGAGLTSGATPALGVVKSMDQVLPGQAVFLAALRYSMVDLDSATSSTRASRGRKFQI